MNKIFFLLLLQLCVAMTVGAQPAYHVGMGAASIEPDASIFSLALAGYGLPREGRFSITWSRVERPAAIHVAEGTLYAEAQAEKLIALRKKDPALVSVTQRDDRLYAANATGSLLTARDRKRPRWKAVPSHDFTGALVSLTSRADKLYALNRGDSLFAGTVRGDSVDWTMIGRNNGETFAIDIKSIAAAGDRLYALSADGALYVNKHSTDGNLGVQALAVRQGDATVVIAAADVCGFEYAFIQGIKDEITRRHRLPPAAVLINATHTHFTPITQDFGPMGPFYETPDDAYMNIVRQGVLDAVDAALADLTPADLFFGRDTTAIGRNRRGNTHPDAPYDNTLDVVVARDAGAGVRGVLFTTACHPVYRNAGAESFTLSANYPGVARAAVASDAGAPNVVFLQGCGGDINPVSADHRETGTDLAVDVARAMDGRMQKITGALEWSLDTLTIPVPMGSREDVEALRQQSLQNRGDLEAERDLRWADKMLQHYASGSLPDALPVYIQIIDIGDWRLVGLSREAVNEYGPAIRALWPGKHVSVAGYCNDVSSYLPNDWHIRAGVYEGNGSFFWYGVHGTFPLGTFERVVEMVRRR